MKDGGRKRLIGRIDIRSWTVEQRGLKWFAVERRPSKTDPRMAYNVTVTNGYKKASTAAARLVKYLEKQALVDRARRKRVVKEARRLRLMVKKELMKKGR